MTVWAKRSSVIPGMAIKSLPSRKFSPSLRRVLRDVTIASGYARQGCPQIAYRPFRQPLPWDKSRKFSHHAKDENMIKVGDKLPSVSLREVKEGGVQEITTDDFFKGKKVALFAVPGAFTSTCSVKHLPSFVNNAEALKAKGIDQVVCTAVNDAAVMRAWGEQGKVTMLADGNGDLARALGLEVDLAKAGMGKRSRRYSMLVDNGVVKTLNVEEPGAYGVSSGDHLLTQL
jgi:peroxiredoxin